MFIIDFLAYIFQIYWNNNNTNNNDEYLKHITKFDNWIKTYFFHFLNCIMVTQLVKSGTNCQVDDISMNENEISMGGNEAKRFEIVGPKFFN